MTITYKRGYNEFVGKVPKFFKFAILEIIVLVIVIIAIISALLYLKIIRIPDYLFQFSSPFKSNTVNNESNYITLSSEIDGYSISLKHKEELKEVLEDWGLFNKVNTPSDKSSLKKISITVGKQKNNINSISGLSSQTSGEVKEDTLFITISLSPKAIENTQVANRLLNNTFFTFLLSTISTKNNLNLTDAQKSEMIRKAIEKISNRNFDEILLLKKI